MAEPGDTHSVPTTSELIRRYPTRESKITRIRWIEKQLEKMEMDDEQNDPKLIQGHISLTRGYRSGCGVLVLCLAALCYRASLEKLTVAKYFFIVFAIVGVFMILRGVLYRPDPKLIQAAYVPHHGTPHYRALVEELDLLARTLSQDLRAEDQV